MASDSDSDWSDVDNEISEESKEKVVCLFCDITSTSTDKCFEHMVNNHEFDMKGFIKRERMDFYQYVKFINFIRSTKPISGSVLDIQSDDYADEKWLLPKLADDLLLQVDVDSILEENDESHNLQYKLSIAEEKAKLSEEFLERTLDDLNKCKKELSALLIGKMSPPSKKEKETEEDSTGYFSSYAHFGIHEEMLKDKVRTDAYKNFILSNSNIFKESIVLDVGCGTSVLSMFSAKAGAKQVFAVDYSEVAYQAMDIVKDNGLDSIIKVMKSKAEDLDLPGKVDVIISEWMGYFLLFESMMDTVLYCRDNYLSSKGCVYPDKCNIQLVALADNTLYASKIGFWDDVYGFRMNAMKTGVLEEPLVTIVDDTKVISKPFVLKCFDLMKVNTPDLDFDEKFELEITGTGSISAIVGYFDTFFEQNAVMPIFFSTSPSATATHWKQTVFFLKDPIPLKSGDKLRGRMFCKKNKKDHRALDIAIILYDEKDEVLVRQHYVLA